MQVNNMLIHSEWMLRIIVAASCGCLIGYERTNRNKEAGLRTHAIIALASALIMVISKYGFEDVGGFDSSRVAAQIVSGVGFLGAGIIFVKHGTVSGLTTAAGMWATSGVGMCIGAGLYDIGISSAILIVIIQTILHKEFIIKKLQTGLTIHLEVIMDPNVLPSIHEVLKENNLSILDIKTERVKHNLFILDIECHSHSQFDQNQFIEEIMNKSYFKGIYFS